ncbi:unnamed protein product [Rotaria sp. Silwood2]|nr:unnamed protein product [Rotaria sp. Silwood2]CAF4617193.1 unnamed protein product [Rotaria sp. Silwood2]
MASRIKNTSSNNLEQKEDIKKLVDILKNSDYPEKEIHRIIKTTLSINNNTIPPATKDTDEIKYSITLPYTPGIEILKRKLKKLQINLFYSYPNKLQAHVNSSIKTKTNSVIYQIECRCGAVYVGETKVGLTKRVKQHEKLIQQNDKRSNSEMVIHSHNNNHQCKFDTTTAIAIEKETNWKRRRIKEAIYSTLNNSINKHDDIDAMWLPIILKNSKQIKKKIQYKQKLRKEEIDDVVRQDGNSGTEDENI